MEILIAGAGIGGLTAALTLHRIGVSATVIEAVREIRPLGVGINVLPHGVAVLSELGLDERLAATAIATCAIEYRTEFGQLILSDPRGRHAGFPWPQYSIHRGHLQMLLLEAARERLGPDRILTGHALEAFTQNESGVVAHVRRRADDTCIALRADALVGADGLHSRVCALLHPEAPPLRFSGVMMWRGAVEWEPFLDGETMVIAGHHDRKAVIYPMSREAVDCGRSLVNWVAEIRVREGEQFDRADWNRPGHGDEFASAFSDWRFDFLDVPALFRATERIFVYPMVDRDPLPEWGFGRVTLLGDAAHPMYPIGANGASQAILDADALATALAQAGSLESGLRAYERERLPTTADIVLSNRQKGPERVLQLARERIRGPADSVADLISQDELDAITFDYRKLAGFDIESLKRRASATRDQGRP
jgi:2-polyprenyl-6-methoxyphenol hydroxylase-like FAD-dependent oxidoreductase